MRFHPRRLDKNMPRRADQLAVIRGQKVLTIAMSDGRQPYLVSLNYAWAQREKCFYAHCASKGRKLQFLRKNPRVWGQVVEDHGPIQGQCNQAYRSVMFQARADLVPDDEGKRRALGLMIDQIETDPSIQRAELAQANLDKVMILRLKVSAMSGKQSPPPKRG